MASLSWDLTRRDGVTLVELVVTAEAEEWVRVNSRLRPVWPPRRQGVPVAGWDDDCFVGRVGPEAPLVLGYASPAEPVDPPAQLEPVEAEGDAPVDDDLSPRTIVRTLGESAPPRDVVHVAEAGEYTGNAATGSDGVAAHPDPGATDAAGGAPTSGLSSPSSPPSAQRSPSSPPRSHSPRSSGASQPAAAADGIGPEHDTVAVSREPRSTGDAPESHSAGETEAIGPWFEAVEGRIAEAERLAEVTGVDEARGAVEAAGGIVAVRELRERLEADRRRLRALGERQQELADRLAAVEIPLSTLERVT